MDFYYNYFNTVEEQEIRGEIAHKDQEAPTAEGKYLQQDENEKEKKQLSEREGAIAKELRETRATRSTRPRYN